jgi:hypothetical protein
LISDFTSIDPVTNRVILHPEYFQRAQDIAKIEDSPEAGNIARTYLNWGRAMQRDEARTFQSNPVTKSALLDGMFHPTDPTTEVDILNKAAQGELNRTDTQILRAMQKATTQLKGPIYQGAMSAAKEALGRDVLADGADRYSGFLQTFIPEYTKLQRAGTLPPNALNTRDPESLISKTLNEFRPTQRQLMEGRMLKRLGVTNIEGLGDAVNAPATPGQTTLPSRTLNLSPGSPDRGDWPTPQTKEEFDALAPGTKYIGADGRPYKKPEKKK